MSPPTLGAILAGGLGRRMGGGDKPLLRLGGRTLLKRVTERLAQQCTAGLILSANGDPARFAGFPGPVVPDGVPGQPGPLAGILAALDHAAELPSSDAPSYPEVRGAAELRGRALHRAVETEAILCGRFAAPHGEGTIGRAIRYVVSVSGDIPFLPHDLVGRLHAARETAGAPIALAASGGRRHFIVALWSIDLRADLRAALMERDERRVGAFIDRHGAATASWPIEPVDPFLNVNTPADLVAAEAALARLDG